MTEELGQVGQVERVTQDRVVKLFQERLKYTYLGNLIDREDNGNIIEGRLTKFLKKSGRSDVLIGKALRELGQAAATGDGKQLYEANKEVYRALRYGIKVKEGVGENNETVWLIDWKNPGNNDFAIAEEVSLKGIKKVRPDLVLYVNGIALGVIELKRSTVSVSEGIRQNLRNQRKDFLRPFFSTIQLVMAGNDTEGLRYGMIDAKEKYFLKWKEENPDYNASVDDPSKRYLPANKQGDLDNALDVSLVRMLEKERLLELLHDFIVFDAGVKKSCRHNQYFGIRAAQEYIRQRQGGILWHTQGSGKSLTMVWLTKWIRENVEGSRVLIITDRIELDEQIEKVFTGVDEEIYRTSSGDDLVNVLNATEEWLICSLVHKFGKSEDDAVEDYLAEIKESMDANFSAKGDIYVFVDECHRTQSGKLHAAMKTILPNALFVGFTGTPLLKDDKQTSLETFGPYIHTYKFNEAVSDGVVLDLRYEARDIDQNIKAQDKIDKWFDSKTAGLTDYARAKLKQKWGTMQKVLSSKSRLDKIVADILLDFEIKDRLSNGRGNAILVSGSIYQACKFYEMFDETELKGKCAIVTSYKPSPQDIKNEETGEGYTEKLHQYGIYRKMLADYFEEDEDTAVNRAEEFEKKVKEQFVDEPGQMRLLIVVDKLLTGFDAPSATYLYIDKKMQDHGLFQAICRVNRLDGDDKEYGYIIDYKDLFNSLEQSIQDYTSGAFDGYDKADVAGLLEDRLTKSRERLDETRETVKGLCEPVEMPRTTPAYIKYFCAEDTSNKDALKANELKRITFYKHVGSFIRAYAALANEMEEAGYSPDEIKAIQDEVAHYEKARSEIMMASGDAIDMKVYEPGMRRLIDSYIQAEESEKISAFDDTSLIELIVERGQDAIDELPKGIRENNEAVAETIENNIRKVIIDESPVNPEYYKRMSELLDALIAKRKEDAKKYKEYLAEIVALTKKVHHPGSSTEYPKAINTSGKKALFDNLAENEELAISVHHAVQDSRTAKWRGNNRKERAIKIAIKKFTDPHSFDADAILEIVKNHGEY